MKKPDATFAQNLLDTANTLAQFGIKRGGQRLYDYSRNLPEGLRDGVDKIGASLSSGTDALNDALKTGYGYVRGLLGKNALDDAIKDGVDGLKNGGWKIPDASSISERAPSYVKGLNAGIDPTSTVTGRSSSTAAPASVAPTQTGGSSVVSAAAGGNSDSSVISAVVPASVESGGNGSGAESDKVMTYEEFVASKTGGFTNQYKDEYEGLKQSYEDQLLATEEQRKRAAVTAEAEYDRAKSTYGANAEAMLDQGLTGGGYSEYLAGKNYEALNNAKIAAQAQKNALDTALGTTYNENLSKLVSDNATAVQEIKNNILTNVSNGIYGLESAKKVFESYGLEADQSFYDTVKSIADEYSKDAKQSLVGTLIETFVNSGATPTKSSFLSWLKLGFDANGVEYNDSDIAAIVDGYFDENGNFLGADGGTISSVVTGNNLAGIIADSTTITNGGYYTKDEISGLVHIGDLAAEYGTTNDFVKKIVASYFDGRETNEDGKYLYEKDDLISYVASKLNSYHTSVFGAKLVSGLVFDKNDWDTTLGDGDNFTIKDSNDTVYKIQSAGEVVDEKTLNALGRTTDGNIKAYEGDLYMQYNGGKWYKLEGRDLNKSDYTGLVNKLYEGYKTAVQKSMVGSEETPSTQPDNGGGAEEPGNGGGAEEPDDGGGTEEPGNGGGAEEPGSGGAEEPDDGGGIEEPGNGGGAEEPGNGGGIVEPGSLDSELLEAYKVYTGLDENSSQYKYFKGLVESGFIKEERKEELLKLYTDKGASGGGNGGGAEEPGNGGSVGAGSDALENQSYPKFEKNTGLFGNGGLRNNDQISVNVNGNSYTVKSGGKVTDQYVIDASKKYGHGELFVYDDKVYMRFFLDTTDDGIDNGEDNVYAIKGARADAVKSAILEYNAKDDKQLLKQCAAYYGENPDIYKEFKMILEAGKFTDEQKANFSKLFASKKVRHDAPDGVSPEGEHEISDADILAAFKTYAGVDENSSDYKNIKTLLESGMLSEARRNELYNQYVGGNKGTSGGSNEGGSGSPDLGGGGTPDVVPDVENTQTPDTRPNGGNAGNTGNTGNNTSTSLTSEEIDGIIENYNKNYKSKDRIKITEGKASTGWTFTASDGKTYICNPSVATTSAAYNLAFGNNNKAGIEDGEVFDYEGQKYVKSVKSGAEVFMVVEKNNKPSNNTTNTTVDDKYAGMETDFRGLAVFNGQSGLDGWLLNNDEFKVRIDGKDYKIKSAGETKDDKVIAAAKQYENGDVFVYDGNVYMKLWVNNKMRVYATKGGGVDEVKNAIGLDNELLMAFRTVNGVGTSDSNYKNFAASLATKTAEQKQKLLVDFNSRYLGEANSGGATYSTNFGFDTGLKKGDTFKAEINNKTMLLKSEGVVDDEKIKYAARLIANGELFTLDNGDEVFLKKNDNVYAVKGTMERALANEINKTSESYKSAQTVSKGEAIESISTTEVGKTATINLGFGKEYKAKIISKLDDNNFVARISRIFDENSLFSHNGEVYLKLKDGVYEIDAATWHKKDYEALAKVSSAGMELGTMTVYSSYVSGEAKSGSKISVFSGGGMAEATLGLIAKDPRITAVAKSVPENTLFSFGEEDYYYKTKNGIYYVKNISNFFYSKLDKDGKYRIKEVDKVSDVSVPPEVKDKKYTLGGLFNIKTTINNEINYESKFHITLKTGDIERDAVVKLQEATEGVKNAIYNKNMADGQFIVYDGGLYLKSNGTIYRIYGYDQEDVANIDEYLMNHYNNRTPSGKASGTYTSNLLGTESASAGGGDYSKYLT